MGASGRLLVRPPSLAMDVTSQEDSTETITGFDFINSQNGKISVDVSHHAREVPMRGTCWSGVISFFAVVHIEFSRRRS